MCLVLVTHTCNPSYLGGWDWEDCSLRPAWANSFRHPVFKKKRKKKLNLQHNKVPRLITVPTAQEKPKGQNICVYVYTYAFVGLGFELRASHLSHTYSSFCSGCFGDEVWPWTAILLISASQVAGIYVWATGAWLSFSFNPCILCLTYPLPLLFRSFALRLFISA
jgi:hypothetical protein